MIISPIGFSKGARKGYRIPFRFESIASLNASEIQMLGGNFKACSVDGTGGSHASSPALVVA